MLRSPIAAACCAVLLASSTALAGNVIISHSGRLLDSNDQPVDGPVTLVVTLHRNDSGSDQIFTDTWTVTPRDGVYQLHIGDSSDEVHKPLDASLFDGGPLWLGVKVNDVALSPRLPVGHVPHAARALVAADVDCVGCIDVDELSFDPTPADGSINAARLAVNSVQTAKIADAAVTGDKLAAGAVDTKHLAQGAVTAEALAQGAVTQAHLEEGAVLGSHIKSGEIVATHLASKTITADQLSDGAITREKIAPGAIPSAVTRALFHFDEGEGSTVADLSGNGNDLTLPGSGAAWTNAGQSGPAIQALGSTGGHLAAPSSTSLALTDAVTIEAWVNPTWTGETPPDFMTVVGKRDQYMLGINKGHLQAAIRTASRDNWGWSGSGLVPKDTWSHVAVTYDGFEIRTYIDHVLTSTTPFPHGRLNVDTWPLTVGGRVDVDEPFSGRIDGVEIAAEARTYDAPLGVIGSAFAMGGGHKDAYYGTDWTPLPDYPVVTFHKKSNTSLLKITVSDNFRTASLNQTSGWVNDSCTVHYGVQMNGKWFSEHGVGPSNCHTGLHTQFHGTTTYTNLYTPLHLTCVATKVPAGTHTFRRVWASSGPNCRAAVGWNQGQQLLLVEEIAQ